MNLGETIRTCPGDYQLWDTVFGEVNEFARSPRDILTDRIPRGACGCAVDGCWLPSLFLSTHTELVIDASHVGWCIVRELHTYVT